MAKNTETTAAEAVKTELKVVVAHFSGNVGKSNIAREVFYPNLKDPTLVEVETFNSSSEGYGLNLKKYKGDELQKVWRAVAMLDNVIIDVGASNIQSFFFEIQKTPEVLADIDMFVVPVMPDAKQAEDTVKTVDALLSLDIPREKIKIVFNRICGDIRTMNPAVVKALEAKGLTLDFDLQLLDYQVVSDLTRHKKIAKHLLEDETDYRALAKQLYAEGKESEAVKAADMDFAKKLAMNFSKNCKKIFDALVAK